MGSLLAARAEWAVGAPPPMLVAGSVVDAPWHDVTSDFRSPVRLSEWTGLRVEGAVGEDAALRIQRSADALGLEGATIRIRHDEQLSVIAQVEADGLSAEESAALAKARLRLTIEPLGPSRTGVTLALGPFGPEAAASAARARFEPLVAAVNDALKRRFPPKDRSAERAEVRRRLAALAGRWTKKRGEAEETWTFDASALDTREPHATLVVRIDLPGGARVRQWTFWEEPREGVWRGAAWKGGRGWDVALERDRLVWGTAGGGFPGEQLEFAQPDGDALIVRCTQGCIGDRVELSRAR